MTPDPPADRDPLAARVARGMAVLDERIPEWATMLDPETLDMNGGEHNPAYGWCGCVLAQLDCARHPDLTGRYDEMLSRLQWSVGEPPDVWAITHGFEAETVSDGEYAALTQAWRDAINARRAAP